MMMMMIMIAGFVDSITTPIKSWLDTSGDEEQLQVARMRVLRKGSCSASAALVDKCIVCLSEVELGERFAMLDTCNHGFHVECVEAWLKHHPNCPLCRTPTVLAAAAAVFPNDHKQTRCQQHIHYLKKFVGMTTWCGYHALDTIATCLTKSFSQGLQSSLSESCTYL